MAKIAIAQDELVIQLTTLEKAEAMHGDVHVPLTDIREVSVVDHPMSAPRGLRAPGTEIPGVIEAGTWHGFKGEGRQFVLLTRGHRGVRIDLAKGQGSYDALLVGVTDPEADAAAIRTAAGL